MRNKMFMFNMIDKEIMWQNLFVFYKLKDKILWSSLYVIVLRERLDTYILKVSRGESNLLTIPTSCYLV